MPSSFIWAARIGADLEAGTSEAAGDLLLRVLPRVHQNPRLLHLGLGHEDYPALRLFFPSGQQLYRSCYFSAIFVWQEPYASYQLEVWKPAPLHLSHQYFQLSCVINDLLIYNLGLFLPCLEDLPPNDVVLPPSALDLDSRLVPSAPCDPLSPTSQRTIEALSAFCFQPKFIFTLLSALDLSLFLSCGQVRRL